MCLKDSLDSPILISESCLRRVGCHQTKVDARKRRLEEGLCERMNMGLGRAL